MALTRLLKCGMFPLLRLSCVPDMSRKKIKIGFVDFDDFYVREVVINVLKSLYDIEQDDENPDILFFSCFGYNHLKYLDKCIKVYVSGENTFPDFNTCDYAITSCAMEYGNRHFYLPPCFYYGAKKQKEEKAFPLSDENLYNRPFCSFLFSSDPKEPGRYSRKEFCERLMKTYKHVDCPGRILHNMDAPELSQRYSNDWSDSKISFIGKYKFNIAFENSDAPGYITEKLTDAYKANTIPIYRGSSEIWREFPKDSMIYAPDYPDMDSLIARIKEVDENKELYMQMLAANPLHHGMSLDKSQELGAFLSHIVEKGTMLRFGVNSRYGDAGALYELLFNYHQKKRVITRVFLFGLHIASIIRAVLTRRPEAQTAAQEARLRAGAVRWRSSL